ncbi:hypothetical protein SAMN05443545_10434 [Aidingimonas halophila]|uniref:Uncharacterized protein n=1 Tax=Aidingimonas halophila TaxID=574349 RepID=A0A1H2Z476_9GAMM|nr:hypothetical protein SAMN05443545_10434 [Aidingimonas halophila]
MDRFTFMTYSLRSLLFGILLVLPLILATSAFADHDRRGGYHYHTYHHHYHDSDHKAGKWHHRSLQRSHKPRRHWRSYRTPTRPHYDRRPPRHDRRHHHRHSYTVPLVTVGGVPVLIIRAD